MSSAFSHGVGRHVTNKCSPKQSLDIDHLLSCFCLQGTIPVHLSFIYPFCLPYIPSNLRDMVLLKTKAIWLWALHLHVAFANYSPFTSKESKATSSSSVTIAGNNATVPRLNGS